MVPDNSPTGWGHDEEDVKRVPRDNSQDYYPGVAVYSPPELEYPFVPDSTPSERMADCDVKDGVPQAGPSKGIYSQPASVEGYTATEAATILRFLFDSGVLNFNDDVTTITEMRGFVLGRMR